MTTYVSCLVANGARMDTKEDVGEEVEDYDEAIVADLLQDIKQIIIILIL